MRCRVEVAKKLQLVDQIDMVWPNQEWANFYLAFQMQKNVQDLECSTEKTITFTFTIRSPLHFQLLAFMPFKFLNIYYITHSEENLD